VSPSPTLTANLDREGRTSRVPMGILFTGPMGTGKTFVAEAFARECGLTTIKLKNFRSKWVGATEGNLEKILGVVRAIGQVVVIIDEGDRAFGATDGESDGGTSSRVIARIKESMSDTSNRGRILFLVMTNRPDKLDVDLKRAGRLDRKTPFFYSQTPPEVEEVARAVVRKNHVQTTVDFAEIRSALSRIARIKGLWAGPTHLWCSSARPRLSAGSVPAPGSGQPITGEPGVATSVAPARCGGGASAVRRTKRPASAAGRLASGCRRAALTGPPGAALSDTLMSARATRAAHRGTSITRAASPPAPPPRPQQRSAPAARAPRCRRVRGRSRRR